jgi:2,4-dichlorophenol 6-monooxygenase
VWLEHQGQKLSSSKAGAQGEKVSTHDLAGKGRFALFSGIGGDGWANAAAEVSADLGIEIAAYVIGPGREVLDTYDDWARAREVSESGCVLVRPDNHVGWRSQHLVDNPRVALASVMKTLLGHATG